MRLSDRGHRARVMTFDPFDEVLPVVACELCGCYSSERYELLLERCRGRPINRPAGMVIRRLARGLHPRFKAAAASSQLIPVAVPAA